MLEILSLQAKSSASKLSLNLIIVIKNSFSSESFLSGPHLLTGMSTLSYLGDYNIILVCSVWWLFDFYGYEAIF